MVSVIVALQLCCCTELLWRHTDCLVMECSLWWWIKYGCSLYLCWTKDLVCASTITSRCCTLLDYRWEEERATDGSKWRFLEHKGPVMAAPYEPLPSNVRFFYDGKINTQVLLILWHLVYVCKLLSGIGWFLRSPLIYVGKQMKLSPEAEEVATFFAKMLDHEYTTKDTFRKNFFKDWRKVGNVQGCILRVCKLPAY